MKYTVNIYRQSWGPHGSVYIHKIEDDGSYSVCNDLNNACVLTKTQAMGIVAHILGLHDDISYVGVMVVDPD